METKESPAVVPCNERHSDASVECQDVQQATSKQAYVILSPENGYNLPEGFAPEFDNRALMFGADTRYG